MADGLWIEDKIKYFHAASVSPITAKAEARHVQIAVSASTNEAETFCFLDCDACGKRDAQREGSHAGVMLRVVGFLFCELFGEFGRIEDSLMG